MSHPMKVLIAYDGTQISDAAIEDLRRAGIPDGSDAVVLSVAELWLPPPSSYGMVDVEFSHGLDDQVRACEETAAEAVERLKVVFPAWTIRHVVRRGSPGTQILHEAIDMDADLVVLGTHGRKGLRKFLLGSVSQKVLQAAPCSVRVSRGRTEEINSPVRLVIGLDGSLGSTAVVDAVAARSWPAGTEARLVTAVGPFSADGSEVSREMDRVRAFHSDADGALQAAGLTVTTTVHAASPIDLLCEQASLWGADCIFVGAWGYGHFGYRFFGSVPAALPSRAGCSVEVVRDRKAASESAS